MGWSDSQRREHLHTLANNNRFLEEQLQSQAQGMDALCPQSGGPLKETRWRQLQLQTVVGTVHLRVRHGYSLAMGQWVCPARRAWGLQAYERLSPELQSRLAYTATEVGSYERAARMAQTWGSPMREARC